MRRNYGYSRRLTISVPAEIVEMFDAVLGRDESRSAMITEFFLQVIDERTNHGRERVKGNERD